MWQPSGVGWPSLGVSDGSVGCQMGAEYPTDSGLDQEGLAAQCGAHLDQRLADLLILKKAWKREGRGGGEQCDKK